MESKSRNSSIDGIAIVKGKATSIVEAVPGKVSVGGVYQSKARESLRVVVTGVYYKGDVVEGEPTVRVKRLGTKPCKSWSIVMEGSLSFFIDAFEAVNKENLA